MMHVLIGMHGTAALTFETKSVREEPVRGPHLIETPPPLVLVLCSSFPLGSLSLSLSLLCFSQSGLAEVFS